jgi:ParE toxin of type II toxin-antitoxin system, parDE
VKIQIGRRARHQVERASSWWHANRPSSPLIFDDEFEHALELLLVSPSSGVPYPTRRRPTLRRLLLPKSGYHVYFSLERRETLTVIHAVWGARRGRSPRL